MQQGLVKGEEREAQLAKQRLIINVLHQTAASGSALSPSTLHMLKTERLDCEDPSQRSLRDLTK